MKRSIITALLMCIAPCLLQAQVKYTLKGKVNSVNDAAKIYLMYRVGNDKRVDSAIPQNGWFSFTGNLAGPVKAYLYRANSAGRTHDFVTVFLEKGTINVNSPDSLKNAAITGSALNNDNKRLQAMLQSVTEKMAKWREEFFGYTDEQKKDKALMDEHSKKLYAIEEEKKMLYRKFIAENAGSYVSLDAIPDVVGYNPDYNNLAPLFNGLSKKLRNSAAGKKMAEKIAKRKVVRIGTMAPDFTQNDTSGIPVKLSSFRGRYVLLDFWASWCEPCRAENPNVVKNFNKYKHKNITVLGVSLDLPIMKENWLKAIHDDQLYWTQVCDPKNAVAELYQVEGIPQNFLIDPSGKIIASNLHGEELDKKLAELLD